MKIDKSLSGFDSCLSFGLNNYSRPIELPLLTPLMDSTMPPLVAGFSLQGLERREVQICLHHSQPYYDSATHASKCSYSLQTERFVRNEGGTLLDVITAALSIIEDSDEKCDSISPMEGM